MGYTPGQFYALTYCELLLLCEGYRERRQNDLRSRREESAWIVSWLLLPHKATNADPLTPAQLLGRKPRTGRRVGFASDADAARAYMAALKAKSKKKGVDRCSEDIHT